MKKLLFFTLASLSIGSALADSDPSSLEKNIQQLAETGECDECYLAGADLRAAIAAARKAGKKIRLIEANLVRADLTEADLQNANLTGANLQEANLRLANLKYALLALANLQRANLQDANIMQANFVDANLWRTIIDKDDLFRFAILKYEEKPKLTRRQRRGY